LAEQGRWAEARQRYQASMALHPHAMTLFNIGYCERQLGKLSSAWWKMSRSLTYAPGSMAALSEENRRHAQAALDELETLLAIARIVPADSPVTLRLQGHLLQSYTNSNGSYIVPVEGGISASSPQSGDFFVVLDPGRYMVELQTDAGTRRVDLEVAAASRPVLRASEAVLVDGTARHEPAPPGISAPPQPASPPAEVARSTPPTRLWMWTALGVGVTGVAVGIGAGVNASWTEEKLDDICDAPDDCPRSAQPDIDSLETSRRISDVGWAVGAAGFALSGILWLIEDDTVDSSARVFLGPDRARLQLRF
jgi:hypothetical protein